MTALRQWPASHVRRGVWRGRSKNCDLRSLQEGDWEIATPEHTVRAQLVQVWPSWGWACLQFAVTEHGPSGPHIRLIVWRYRTPAAAWRQLRVIMARQAAMPGRITGTEGS